MHGMDSGCSTSQDRRSFLAAVQAGKREVRGPLDFRGQFLIEYCFISAELAAFFGRRRTDPPRQESINALNTEIRSRFTYRGHTHNQSLAPCSR